LYSTVRFFLYMSRSAATRQSNSEIQTMYENAKETIIPETSIASASVSTSTPTFSPTAIPQLLNSYQYIGKSFLPEAEEMLSQNPDTIAWIRIPDVVNLPIVYRNNSYYLDHNFHGKKSNSGTLFLDEAHPFLSDTQYLVVHGHSMHDGSMFGYVSLYRKKGYMEQHPVVYFNTLYREEEYEVIGVLRISLDINSQDYFPYCGTRKFETVEQFFSFVDSIHKHAMYWKDGVEMLSNDAFLALSTCYHDDRIVVLCRRTHP